MNAFFILFPAFAIASGSAGIRNDTIPAPDPAPELEIVTYNHPGAVADLGVGLWAWPLPMDYDRDGDMDILVSCPDKPFNGTYFFENVSGEVFPEFAPPVRLGNALKNVQVSYVDGDPRVLIAGKELRRFRDSIDGHAEPLFPVDSILNDFEKKPRFNQWKVLDYDNDGDEDLIVGVDDWTDYGWDNAYDKKGNWTNGPLHGYVYLIENRDGRYLNRGRLEAGGKVIDVYGAPSPNLADFDGDGDLDLICGEFLDKLTWFENTGTRERPEYAEGKYLTNAQGVIRMDLQMIVPVAVDWDKDGHPDLVVGDEDGRVALVRNTGQVKERTPVFESPRYFKQQADHLKFGALATPFSTDWDNDGDEDLITGNSAGYIAFIENLDGGNPPRWAPPRLLEAAGEVIRIQAGANGSIQGPAEAKWGYTTLSVADWDRDGLKDIIVNSIWGKVLWYRNTGTSEAPVLAAAAPVKVSWGAQAPPKPEWNWWSPGRGTLSTQWRTTPYATDWNGDGLTDLIMLDHEGYLSFFERKKEDGELVLIPGQRIFYSADTSGFGPRHEPTVDQPGLLRLNTEKYGRSGRVKFALADWDNDGLVDILVNSVNISFMKNRGTKAGKVYFTNEGTVAGKVLAGHTTSPTIVDWNNDGLPDLLVGAEDGHFYHLENPASDITGNDDLPPLAQPGEGAYIKGSLIYPLDDKPTPECHASTIVETPSGMVAAFFAGTHERHPDVGIRISRLVNGVWTRPEEVVNGVQNDTLRYPCWNPVLFRPADGPLMLFYKVGPSPSIWWGMLTTSDDDGRSWSAPRKLGEDDKIGHLIGPVKNKPVQLSDGTIICPSSTEDEAGDDDLWKVHFEISHDRGKTWEVVGPINDGVAFDAIQPSILRYPNGRLQILCRTRQNVLAQSWSEDQGRTWSEMQATGLPNPNSGTDAVTLQDGRQLLVYNHTTKEGPQPNNRNMLNVAISENGLEWTPVLTLENQPHKSGYSYPAVIQASDGMVHITYTYWRESVKHIVLDPSRL